MDETTWRTATHLYQPIDLLGWVEPRLTRQQRLRIGAAWMRRIWDLLADPRFREMVEVAEGMADGTRTEAEFDVAEWALPRAANYGTPGIVNYNDLPSWVRTTHTAARLLTVGVYQISVDPYRTRVQTTPPNIPQSWNRSRTRSPASTVRSPSRSGSTTTRCGGGCPGQH
jgi:hypothetical protein